MAAPVINAQVANSAGNAAVTDPWTLGSLNVQSGDQLVVVMVSRVRQIVGVTQDPGGTPKSLTQIDGGTLNDGTAYVTIWRHTSPTTGSLLDIEIDPDGTGEAVGGVAFSISGIVSLGTEDVVTAGTGESATITLDGSADDLNLCGAVKYGGGSGNAFTPGTMTEDLDTNPAGTIRVGVFHETADSSPAISWTTNDAHVFAGMSFSGAAAGGPPTIFDSASPALGGAAITVGDGVSRIRHLNIPAAEYALPFWIIPDGDTFRAQRVNSLPAVLDLTLGTVSASSSEP